MDDSSDAAAGSSRLTSFKRFCRDVAINVLANVLAVPIIYLVGAATGIFRRIPAAVAVSACVIAAAFMLGSITAMFLALRESRISKKIYKIFLAASASAMAVAVFFIGVGLDAFNRTHVGAIIGIVIGIVFAINAVGLLTSGIKHRREMGVKEEEARVR